MTILAHYESTIINFQNTSAQSDPFYESGSNLFGSVYRKKLIEMRLMVNIINKLFNLND